MKNRKMWSLLLGISLILGYLAPVHGVDAQVNLNVTPVEHTASNDRNATGDNIHTTTGGANATGDNIHTTTGGANTTDDNTHTTTGDSMNTATGSVTVSPAVSNTPSVGETPSVSATPSVSQEPVISGEPVVTIPVSSGNIISPQTPSQTDNTAVEAPVTNPVGVSIVTKDDPEAVCSRVFLPQGKEIVLCALPGEGISQEQMQYQWLQDGREIAGATAASKTIPAGAVGSVVYTCRVTLGNQTGEASVTVVTYRKKLTLTLGNTVKINNVFDSGSGISQKNITNLAVKTKQAKKSFQISGGNVLKAKRYYKTSQVTFMVEDAQLQVQIDMKLPQLKMSLKLSGNKRKLMGTPKIYGASKIEFQYQSRNKKWESSKYVSGKFKKPNKRGVFKNPTPIKIKKYRVRAVYKVGGKRLYTKWSYITV